MFGNRTKFSKNFLNNFAFGFSRGEKGCNFAAQMQKVPENIEVFQSCNAECFSKKFTKNCHTLSYFRGDNMNRKTNICSEKRALNLDFEKIVAYTDSGGQR